jgi:hypothetical protein
MLFVSGKAKKKQQQKRRMTDFRRKTFLWVWKIKHIFIILMTFIFTFVLAEKQPIGMLYHVYAVFWLDDFIMTERPSQTKDKNPGLKNGDQ